MGQSFAELGLEQQPRRFDGLIVASRAKVTNLPCTRMCAKSR